MIEAAVPDARFSLLWFMLSARFQSSRIRKADMQDVTTEGEPAWGRAMAINKNTTCQCGKAHVSGKAQSY